MPSFDIVSKIDLQELDNAINNVKKEIQTRYDFKTGKAEIDLNKKDKKITLLASDEMKMRAMQEMLAAHLVRRKLDARCLEYADPEEASGGAVRVTGTLREGINKETGQKIVKLIKASGIKVQPAIQDEQVRVTGKKIDDLQAVINLLNQEAFDRPLQFENMKR
ncbi:YajQ family cyclic di-GMP-binding protein [Megalodesulfovibrio paquesii]